jgi:hypothetical protein
MINCEYKNILVEINRNCQYGEWKKPGELRCQPSIFIPLGKAWVTLSEYVSKVIIEYASMDLQHHFQLIYGGVRNIMHGVFLT